MKGITEAVNVKLIINDDKDLTVKTALYKDSKRGALEHGAILTSGKLSGLLSDNEGNRIKKIRVNRKNIPQ